MRNVSLETKWNKSGVKYNILYTVIINIYIKYNIIKKKKHKIKLIKLKKIKLNENIKLILNNHKYYKIR